MIYEAWWRVAGRKVWDRTSVYIPVRCVPQVFMWRVR